MSMTPEEKRIVIAEVRGWTGCYATDRYVTGIDPLGIERDLPDYFHDLNACHEMEKALTDAQLMLMRNWLEEITERPGRIEGGVDYSLVRPRFWRATAEQRAEAFLRTLELWKE